MKTTLKIETTRSIEAVDITEQAEQLAADLSDGDIFVYTKHTTVALVLCPGDDDFLRDIEKFVGRWPEAFGPYDHAEEDNPNSPAHLVSAVGGVQLLLPVDEGRIDIGTYQRLVLVELDGPRSRAVTFRTRP